MWVWNKTIWTLAAAMAICAAAISAHAQQAGVTAQVDKNEVALGEPLLLTLDVEGADAIQPPDLSRLEGFAVQYNGGQRNSGTSVTIVNGQMSRVVRRGYVMQYRLTPQRKGELSIPSISVEIDGAAFSTEPISIHVGEPQQTNESKFDVTLSKTQCYAGEPVVLTATWYFASSARNVTFSMPVLEDKRLLQEDMPLDPHAKHPIEVEIGSVRVVGEQGQVQINGRVYGALRFQRVIIPPEPGEYRFSPATAAAELLTNERRPRSPFDDFFNDAFSEGGTYRTYVATSEPLALTVLPLPAEGRPDNFTGLVGEYAISASARPTEANVGDPITLSVHLSGPEFLGRAELPSLEKQPEFTAQFQIPKDHSPGVIENGVKTFTQTIRPMNAEITAIPPIRISFFDTKTGTYQTAETAPIPITVHPAKVLTAEDVEGHDGGRIRNELTASREGIAHNYEGPSVLANQAYGMELWLRSPLWMALAGGPPLAWLILALGAFLARRRWASPERLRERRAYGDFAAAMRKLKKAPGGASPYAGLHEALRAYLGAKLRAAAAALTYNDVREPLRAKGASDAALDALKAILAECEAHQYAGGHTAESSAGSVLTRALDVVKAIEKEAGR